MSDEIQPKLNTAFEHVEAGRLEEAIALLNPILETAPDNADAWWIYAHAVSDPQEARRALANVMRIMPDYPGARDLQDILDRDFPAPPVQQTARPVIKSLASAPPPPPSSMPEPPKNIPETPSQSVEDADEFDDIFNQRDEPLAVEAGEESQSPSRTSIVTIAIFAVVVAAIVLALILLNPGDETVPPTATTLAVIAPTSSPTTMIEAVVTAESTAEITVQPTTEVTPDVVVPTTPAPEVMPEITPEVTSAPDPLGGLSELLSTLTLPDEEERTEIVTLNDVPFTIVRICSNPGPEARALLRRAMSELAGEAETLSGETQGYGVRLINCADGTTLVATAALTEDAARFARGELAETAFAATWQPFR